MDNSKRRESWPETTEYKEMLHVLWMDLTWISPRYNTQIVVCFIFKGVSGLNITQALLTAFVT